MPIEAATYIADLNAANPLSGEFINEGDDHLKLLKSVLKASMPNITGPVTATHTELNLLDGLTAVVGTSTPGAYALLATTTISGSPAAIDYLNGVSGVVIDATYDEYIIEFSYVYSDAGLAGLRLQLANNGAGSFTNATTSSWELTEDPAWTTGSALTYTRLTQDFTPTPTTYAAHGRVRLGRVVGTTSKVPIFGTAHWTLGSGGCVVLGVDSLNATSTQFSGIRLLWNTGNFANSGTIKLWGRRA